MNKWEVALEKHRGIVLEALDYIWKNPETGYREWKTHAYLEEAFAKLGYELTLAGDIPGFTAMVDTGREGPTVAVFGEMDALICENHPEADPQTGAVHSCGHCAQVAALLGMAAALKEPGALDGMCGKILLVVVPAEELIEVEYREELRKKGIIRYFGGKPEFLARGLLDGVDISMMIHTGTSKPNTGSLNKGSNGCIAKTVTFQGVSAHAGGAPHLGVNALYAANLALSAINALRETFQDSDHIRVHPIITAGGDAVNAIPDTVKMESYIRGASIEAIVEVNKKFNRAMAAAAAAMGAKVHLCDQPGYFPRLYSEMLNDVMEETMKDVLDEVTYDRQGWAGGCSDIGDMGALMPIIHPHIGGATGKSHGNDYFIADPDSACIKSALAQLRFLSKILGNNAALAKEATERYQPTFSCKEEYFAFMDKLALNQNAVSYGEDGSVTLNFK